MRPARHAIFARAAYLVAGVIGIVVSALMILSVWYLPLGVVVLVLSGFSLAAARASALGLTSLGRAVAATTAVVALFC